MRKAKYRRLILLWCGVLLGCSTFLNEASSETDLPLGYPLVRTYSPREYSGHVANRFLARNSKGVLFVANEHGLFSYDGASWRQIEKELLSQVFSVAVDENDRLYLGLFDDFGYLEMASNGKFAFTSLVGYVPEEFRGDQMYENIVVENDRVVFCTSKCIYVWNTESKEVRVAEGLDNHSDTFVLKDRIYATSNEYPLRVLTENGLEQVAGSDFFSTENSKIQEVATDRDGNAFLVTSMDGIYSFDGESFELFSDAREYVSEWRMVDSALVLKSGDLVVGTRKFGMFVFNKTGRLIQHIDKSSGLSDNWVSSLIADRFGGVWMVQNKGISRVQLESPITVYNSSHGLEGSVNFVDEYEGELFVGTSVGLYRGVGEGVKARFVQVPGVQECKSLLNTDHGLLVGTIWNLLIFKDGSVNMLFEGMDSSYLHRHRKDPGLIVVAGYPGLSMIRETDTGWERVGTGRILDKPVHGIAEASDGSIWLKSGLALTRRIQMPEGQPVVEEFGMDRGLPEGWISPLSVEGRVVFSNSDGRLFQFNESSRRFEPEDLYSYFPESSTPGFLEIVGDDIGQIWVTRGNGTGDLVPKPKGDYVLGMQYLSEMVDVRASALHIEDSGIVWLGSFDGLTRFDERMPGSDYGNFETVIRSVESMDNSETAYFEGSKPMSNKLVFEPGCSSVRVRLSTSWPIDPEGVLYRIYLDGFDRDVPEFGKNSLREIVNLPPGEYVLKAESMDSLGRLGTYKKLAIRIVAPWYKSKLAYAGYVLLGVFLVYLIFWYRTRILNRTNQQLRELVEQRTGELAKQSLALEDRNVELEVRNKELKQLAERATEAASAKARFLAVVSHEIRTPMNGVMGMCYLLNKTGLSDEQLEFTRSIESSSDSLLNIIDDILDYSKIDEGRLQFESIEFDIVGLVEKVAIMLGPQANSKALEIHLKIDPQIRRVRIGDPTRIRQVIVNLAGNALKYTEKGNVSIAMYPGDSDNEIVFDVEDTGIGIQQSKMETIFEPFFQADVSNVRKYGGTGLGLAICKQIVDGMKGSISVCSEENVGSCFRVRFPLQILGNTEPLWDCAGIRGKRIGVCCTDPNTLKSLAAYLAAWEASIVELDTADLFMNARDFLNDCDLVILEHKMVSFDGMELAQRVMALDDEARLPVVLLVSRMNEQLRVERDKVDRLTLLAKPLIPTRLLEVLRTALEKMEKSAYSPSVGDGGESNDFSDLSVLVAEDNELNQDIVERLLQSLNAKVKVVCNGEEAVEEYFKNEYDLVLMDIQMPIASGIEATRDIFERKGKGPMPFVYGLSAGVMREERLRCAEAGMVGFIRKPFDFEDLVDALRAARDQQLRRKLA